VAQLFLGVDLGTSATKLGVFDAQGRRIALARAECKVARPKPGWAEQNPDDWWTSVLTCWSQIRAEGVPPNDIRAVGLSGHFTVVFLDEYGRPARPAITWQDARADEEAAYLADRYDAAHARALFGVNVPVSPAMPAAKIRWVMTRCPEEARRVRWVAQAKDYVALQLCGEVCSDPQSLIGIVHPSTGDWDDAYLADLGLIPAHIPRITPPFRNAGYVTKEAYDATGIRIGVPVIMGCVDALCSMLATGVYRPGAAFDYAGTSEIVGLRVPKPPEDHPGLIALPFDRKSAVVYGLTNCGADVLSWARDALGADSYEEVLALAAEARPDADAPLFLPYLDGERSPVWDADARGAWLNVRRHHGRAELAFSVLEGVAFAVAQILRLAAEAAGVQPEEIVVSGGGARSDLWAQVRADVVGLPVQVVEEAETGALGAAMLAAVGFGEFEAMADAAEAMTRVGKRLSPRRELREIYRRRQRVYDAAYAATRSLRP
jgi:sugar (pentulose or hexulose) kinase